MVLRVKFLSRIALGNSTPSRQTHTQVRGMRDILSDVLNTLELESSLYFRAELTSPFSIAVPENPGVIRFHIASGGQCKIRTNDSNIVEFGHGDLIMVPHGFAHVLSDSEHNNPEALSRVLDQNSFEGQGPLVYGGGGAQTTLVCGHFSFSQSLVHPFLRNLPQILVLKQNEGVSYAWIEQLLAYAEEESKKQSMGWHTIIDRLSQILLVCVLRKYTQQDSQTIGALAALADSQLSACIQAIHGSPARDWTLDELARKANMSRSSFVRKFRNICDMSPMQYLTHWRMQKARYLLVKEAQSTATISEQVGYSSEASFSRAFKEVFGAPPATYKRSYVSD